jgi:alanyl-tRNA synthetase
MTERIYYTHAYQQHFTATVLAVQSSNDRLAVQLDQSCFYPTSGGQACDTGQLAGVQVVDVLVDEAGVIQHLVAAPTAADVARLAVGNTVEGTIDWARRYDHMQQHSGQHLLSQSCYQTCGFETVAVHFGATESTVDLATAAISATQLAEIESLANALVYKALPIRAYFVDEATIETIPLRRPPKVRGTIRIVEIDAFDYSACGGTHCHTTAEIGPVKITKVERRRDQVRVTFLCGGRAYRDYVEKHRLLTEAATLFNNEIQQVPALIERALGQVKALERALSESQAALLVHEAAALMQAAEPIGPLRLVHVAGEGKSAEWLKALAIQLQHYPGSVALLASHSEEKVTLCFACETTLVQQHNLNMGELLRTTIQPLGGKGGGKADFAQGGGIAVARIAEAIDVARQELLGLFDNELTKAD